MEDAMELNEALKWLFSALCLANAAVLFYTSRLALQTIRIRRLQLEIAVIAWNARSWPVRVMVALDEMERR
jgi:hypothetical protein